MMIEGYMISLMRRIESLIRLRINFCRNLGLSLVSTGAQSRKAISSKQICHNNWKLQQSSPPGPNAYTMQNLALYKPKPPSAWESPKTNDFIKTKNTLWGRRIGWRSWRFTRIRWGRLLSGRRSIREEF